jgi:hypothetical protein
MDLSPCFQKRLTESEERFGNEVRAIREEVAVLAREDFEGAVLTKMERGVLRCEAEKQARDELRDWMEEWTELEKQRIQEVLHDRIVRNYFVYRALR